MPLAQSWPQDVYSLSHVAVPFPPDDNLYGREPRVKNRYGISLGTIALWGDVRVERRERGAYAGHLEPVLRLYAGEDLQPDRGPEKVMFPCGVNMLGRID